MLDVESSKMPEINDEDLTVQDAINNAKETNIKNKKRHERRKKKRELEKTSNSNNNIIDQNMFKNIDNLDTITEK